jgi:hypothetical protein
VSEVCVSGYREPGSIRGGREVRISCGTRLSGCNLDTQKSPHAVRQKQNTKREIREINAGRCCLRDCSEFVVVMLATAGSPCGSRELLGHAPGKRMQNCYALDPRCSNDPNWNSCHLRDARVIKCTECGDVWGQSAE